MSAYDFPSLVEHVGHDLECVIYGDSIHGDQEEVSVECVTCSVVLLSYAQSDNLGARGDAIEQAKVRLMRTFKCDANDLSEALDEAVHDAASSMASDINNGGVESQIAYLTDANTVDEIVSAVSALIEIDRE